MLPTESRFLDLTEEQLELMYQHYLIDNPPKAEKTNSAHDPEYEEPPEAFYDPDFDEEWEKLGKEEPIDEHSSEQQNTPSINNPKEWEEV